VKIPRVYEIVKEDYAEAIEFFRTYPEEIGDKIILFRSPKSYHMVVFHGRDVCPLGTWAEDGRVTPREGVPYETEVDLSLSGRSKNKRTVVKFFQQKMGKDVQFIKSSLEEDFL